MADEMVWDGVGWDNLWRGGFMYECRALLVKPFDGEAAIHNRPILNDSSDAARLKAEKPRQA